MRPEWVHGLEGGIAIGLATSLLLLGEGQIAGISGILSRVFSRPVAFWRWAFLAGLVLAGFGGRLAGLPVSAGLSAVSWPVFVLAGLLVGIGTRLANGCTSGHGICGLANLSGRSLVAVTLFMGTAALVVFLRRHG